MRRRAIACAFVAVAAVGACAEGPGDEEVAAPAASDDDAGNGVPQHLLPIGGDALAPSLARFEGEEVDARLLADVETCAGCHAEIVAEWRGSAHGHSSFDNPWYRSAVDIFRADVGERESRLCASCHDPLLLFTGRIDGDVRPEDPLAHAGITCMVCHGIVDARPDGDGSYTLSTAPVEIPDLDDPESIRRHKERLNPEPLRTTKLCGSCHRVFLGTENGNAHFVQGLDELEPWRASAYGGNHATLVDRPVQPSTCQGCHMAPERATRPDRAASNGLVSSHRWTGGQTALAAQQDERDAAGRSVPLGAVQDRLRSAATIDVAAVVNGAVRTLPADGAAATAGDRLTIEVVVRNVGTGHLFPGGVRDTQDVWIDLRVHDARGRPIAGAGAEHERSMTDPTAHRLMTLMLGDGGGMQLSHLPHRFRVSGYDHTVTARGARLARYELDLPESLPADAFPLRIEARLRQRRHVLPMAQQACEASRSPRGRAFMRATISFGKEALDACERQPLTDLARAAVWIGEGAGAHAGEDGAARPAWERLYDHALASLEDLQENLGQARPSLERALELAPEDDVRARAMIFALRAKLEGSIGRLDDALRWAARAEEIVGEHAAIERIRGRAYAQVWQWERAARAYERVVELAPGDTWGYRDLARARGSAGDRRGALDAAAAGLRLQPRDEWLLRSQALAARGLGLDDAQAASDAYVVFRPTDDTQELRLACGRDVPNCERDRQPVPTIRMRLHGRIAGE